MADPNERFQDQEVEAPQPSDEQRPQTGTRLILRFELEQGKKVPIQIRRDQENIVSDNRGI